MRSSDSKGFAREQGLRRLHDWREEGEQPSLVPSLLYGFHIRNERIDIQFADGRAVWIEQEDGRVTVHVYDAGHDAPVNVRLDVNRVTVDADDRREE